MSENNGSNEPQHSPGTIESDPNTSGNNAHTDDAGPSNVISLPTTGVPETTQEDASPIDSAVFRQPEEAQDRGEDEAQFRSGTEVAPESIAAASDARVDIPTK